MRGSASVGVIFESAGHARRRIRIPAALLSVIGMVLATLAITGAPATAAQAPGHDVPIWSNGWSWTYATTFTYNDGQGTNATINENVTYTNAGPATFMGQDAYKLTITGNITGGSGHTTAAGGVDLEDFSGSVSGTRYVRRADLALLQEQQHQDLHATAKKGIISVGVDADIDLTMTPNPGWRTHDFPLNGGDSWHSDTDVAYNGGFSYSSSLASGSGPFDGTLNFDAPATVTTGTIGVPIGNVATDIISATSNDGTIDNHWWSPTHKNDARHYMKIPMDDGAVATIDRRLSSASTPAPAATITETITPSLTCGGDTVTVSGKVGNTSGVPVSIALDKSPVNPGQKVSVSTSTTANGNYSATITAPGEYDGMAKNGSRANWGVLVSGGGATNVATLVVTPQSCSSIDYTGATAAAQGSIATVSAKLTDLTGGSTSGRTVTFSLSGGGSVNGTTNAAGVATASLPIAGPPRDATITASYAGSAGLAAATETVPFTVGKIGTSTTVTPSESEVTVGDAVTFTAAVVGDHGGTPGGTVQFVVDGQNFGAAVPLNGGSATSAPISTLGLGTHQVAATYNGNADFAGSTSPEVSFTVRTPRLTTTTTSSVTPSSTVFGQPVTLSASVVSPSGGTPTGSVSFRENGVEIAAAVLNGSGEASTTISSLDVGSHSIVARYSGDDDYNVSNAAPKTVTVGKAAVAVQVGSADTTTVTGEAVSFTADVSPVAPGGGAPNGSVQLVIDGANVGAPVELDAGGAAFPPVTSLGAGSHTVAVQYAGGSRYQEGSDSLQQEVAKADTTTTVIASPSPSNEGQNVTFTANVAAVAPGSGTPTGTVTFTADGDLVGAASLDAGIATVSLADLPPGSYSVVASYSGNADYTGGASEAISHTVIEGAPIVPTSTVLTSSGNPSTYGGLITFRADVDAEDGSTPAGVVQFSVDGTNIGGPIRVDGDGVAESPSLASPDPGDHTVIAAFQPDEGFSGSGDILTQTVETAGVDLEVESSAPDATVGDEVTFSATVTSQVQGTGSPTGHVQFMIDGQPLGNAVPLEDGHATSPAATDLGPGVYQVSVIYSGDVRFSAATTSYTQTVDRVQTTTTLGASATSITYGQPVALTATVTPAVASLGTPTGSVQFVEGDTVLATVPLSAGPGSAGVATATVDGLNAGSHPIKAIYSGAATFDASTSDPVTITVGKAATSIKADPALISLQPLGLPLTKLKVTLTAGSDPVAGVPVTFKVGNNTVCTVVTDAAGVATCNAFVQLLGLTLTGYTASFPGNDNYLPASAKGWPIK